MSSSTAIAQHLPYLRRYARALCGSQRAGDSFVQATLEAAIADPTVKASLSAGKVALYKAFNAVWSSAHMELAPGNGEVGSHEIAAKVQLEKITPLNRQALLLTTLEDFSIAEAAEVMGLRADQVDSLAQEAVSEIEKESVTQVLIIEDEPLISMQLEDLVQSLGHSICGTAATQTQAQEVVANYTPGLVLADIQLADGSSGIDAVEDILKIAKVPVIFITAYPERLLTGDRPEPTYLVTKPFEERTVQAAMSQALFFGSTQPLT